MEYTTEAIDELWENYRVNHPASEEDTRLSVNGMFGIMRELIRKEVLEETNAEMECLRNELKKIQDFRDKYDEYQQEKYREITKARMEAQDMIYKAKTAQLSELLFSDTAYTVTCRSVRPAKCDLCDANRKRTFISPLGREMSEPCTCSPYVNTWEVTEAPLFRIDAEKNSVYRYYYRDSHTYWSADILERKDTDPDHLYRYGGHNEDDSAKEFRDINRYYSFFWKKEDAQAYADWLNEQERTGNK